MENFEKIPLIFLACSICGSGMANTLSQRELDAGKRTTSCLDGHPMTIDPAKVPRQFSPEAFYCSPDDSCVACWVPPGGYGFNLARGFKKPPRPKTTTTGLGDVEDQVEALASLRNYEKANRARFQDDPILLEAFDRLIARKKRSIMGNPD